MYKQLVNNILICIGIVSLVSCRGDAQEIITNMKGGISAPGISDTGPGLNPDTGPGLNPDTDTGGTDPGETVPEPEPVLDPNLYYTIPAAWGEAESYPGLQDITDRFDTLYEINQSFAIKFSEDVTTDTGLCTLKNYIVYTVELDEDFFDYEDLTILQRTATVMYELTSCVLNQNTALSLSRAQYDDGATSPSCRSRA